jgi:ubiquinone biosynthesis protein
MNLTRPVRSLARWRDVQVILLKYGFDILIDREEINDIRILLKKRLKVSIGSFEGLSTPHKVRMMLQELGPTYVKLGQILSSRNDLIGDLWTSELARLQDNVPPFAFEQVRRTIEEDLGKSLEELFLSFEVEPIAAASIGQVHRATLVDRGAVVVKVQRPRIHQQVQSDIEIMREIAKLIETRFGWGKRFGIIQIVEEFARTLLEELDYRNEAANARRLRYNMESEAHVHVPSIYNEMTSQRVLTMEDVQGVRIDDLSKLNEAEIDRPFLANIFISSIFKQLLLDGFFHCDPHPGNLLVNLDERTLNYIDLGQMGSLLTEQREQLCDVVGAIMQRDSKEVTRLLMVIGHPYQKVNEIALRRSVDHILYRYLEDSLEHISLASLLNEVLTAVFESGLRLPGEFSMAIKTIIQGEAVAHVLDPDIVVLDIARKVAEQILWQRMDPRQVTHQVNDVLKEVIRTAQTLPHAAEILLHQLENGSLKIGLDVPDFGRQVDRLSGITNRMTVGLIFMGSFIGSAIAMGVSPDTHWPIIPIIGVIGFVLSLVLGGLLVWLVFWDMWISKGGKKR